MKRCRKEIEVFIKLCCAYFLVSYVSAFPSFVNSKILTKIRLWSDSKIKISSKSPAISDLIDETKEKTVKLSHHRADYCTYDKYFKW